MNTRKLAAYEAELRRIEREVALWAVVLVVSLSATLVLLFG